MLSSNLNRFMSGGFVTNVSAYAASEAAAKISRLGVVLAVARTMDPAAIGLAAAAMAASDLLKSLTENGVVHRIIRAQDSELEAVCRMASRIFTAWCLGLIALQAILAAVMWQAFDEPIIASLIAILSLEYIFMPAGLVQCALAMREGRLKATAAIAGGQIIGANLVTAALVVLFPIPLAIVLPKVLSAPLWLYGMRRLRPWRRSPGPIAPLAEFTRFGAAILGVEVMKALRLQADKLLIGGLLGAEALGLWFFAVNAGLGLATSFANAFAVVLFPYLCAATDRASAFTEALKTGVVLMLPMIGLQALLAPTYVPILFGEAWSEITPIVSILCLSAAPALLWTATAQRLRADDRPGIELAVSALLAAALATTVVVLAPKGLEAVAWGYLATATLIQTAAFCAFLPPPNRQTKEA